MTNLHRLPLAGTALFTASPAIAHDATFFHTHGEGLMAVGALGIAAALAFRFIRSRARK